ncbi:hypothetical protein KC870_22790, partial [Enterobacter hormaechei]|uniref:hypothetical protein n=1 Tax=Enterobacter hormaechei TaxID=158836 RepID=UPI0033161589
GLTALTAEFTVGEGKLMTHDEPCSMAPDDKHDLISGTCSHLPLVFHFYLHRISPTYSEILYPHLLGTRSVIRDIRLSDLLPYILD